MGDKIKKYILFGLVLLIWGIIAYRIINITKPSSNQHRESYDSRNRFEKGKIDTFKLLLNYPDPFVYFKTSERQDNKKMPIEKAIKEAGQSKTFVKGDVKWPDVLYGGIIKNNISGKQILLLTINKKEYLMKVNDTLEGLLIKEVYPDSIKLLKGKIFKTYYKFTK